MCFRPLAWGTFFPMERPAFGCHRQKRFTLWEGVQPREHLPFKSSAAPWQQHSASNCGPCCRNEWRERTRTRIFMQKAKRRLSCSRLKRESRWALRTKQLELDKATVWVWLYLVPEGQAIQQELFPTRGFWGCWACFHRGHQGPCWHPRLQGLSLLDSVLLSPFDLWGWSIPLCPVHSALAHAFKLRCIPFSERVHVGGWQREGESWGNRTLGFVLGLLA